MATSCAVNENEESLMASVQLWMSRLQLITVVSAFFASTDGLLLGRVGAYDPTNTSTGSVLTHATLSGALALHTSAAIIAYLASFVLVKYSRVSVPISEEGASGYPGREPTTSTPGGTIKSPSPDHPLGLQSLSLHVNGAFDPTITIERVRLRNLFRKKPPMQVRFHANSLSPGTVTTPELQDAYTVLLRCNGVCVVLTFVGLLLALTGIMAYVWTTFTLPPGIVVSVCFIVSLAAACFALR